MVIEEATVKACTEIWQASGDDEAARTLSPESGS